MKLSRMDATVLSRTSLGPTKALKVRIMTRRSPPVELEANSAMTGAKVSMMTRNGPNTMCEQRSALPARPLFAMG
jgi:hypothetical protein